MRSTAAAFVTEHGAVIWRYKNSSFQAVWVIWISYEQAIGQIPISPLDKWRPWPGCDCCRPSSILSPVLRTGAATRSRDYMPPVVANGCIVTKQEKKQRMSPFVFLLLSFLAHRLSLYSVKVNFPFRALRCASCRSFLFRSLTDFRDKMLKNVKKRNFRQNYGKKRRIPDFAVTSWYRCRYVEKSPKTVGVS